jgi:hypothetical protein
MKNWGNQIARFIIFAIFASGCICLSFSCKPATGLFPTDKFVEADTVYYCDLIIFIGENQSPMDIVVCEFGREKRGENYAGEFWGCISNGGNWDKLEKSGKFRLLTSRPSVPEGPPGVNVEAQGTKFKLEYAAQDYDFGIKSKSPSTNYVTKNDEKMQEYYSIAEAELTIGQRQERGKIFYGFTRWVGYQPITTKYKGRYKDFQRFFLFDDDVLIIASENQANLANFASKYELPVHPNQLNALVRVGRFQKSFGDFKSFTTDRSFDLALFRIPFGWEVEFEKDNSVVLSGEGYYLDNKVLTGRAFIEVTGALSFRGHDYELAGVCEFIK